MKKVKFFIGTLSNGGAEKVVANLSLNMSEKLEKEIILFGKKSKVEYNHNAKLTYIDRLREENIILKVYALIYRINKIRNMKRENPEVPTISFLEYPNLINLITRKSGRTIISVRNHMSSKYTCGMKSIFWNLTIKYLYGKAEKIIAVSEEIKKDLITNYGIDEDRIKVIYNSYNINQLINQSKEEIEEEYNNVFNNPVVITVGRFNKQKGHKYLIRAFTKVKDNIPNAKLVILGRGGLENELKKLVHNLNIQESIFFIGFKENPFKYISKSSLFVLSSLHEGFPNALAEAMACGVPIISTDCLSGPREILAPTEFGKKNINYDVNKKRYGILTPVFIGDLSDKELNLTTEENIMADRIIEILKDNKLNSYFAYQSIERVKDFDIKNIIEMWESII